jgi:hypothetical protein
MIDSINSADIEFNPRNHRYKIKDTKPAEYIPSVTTITGLLDKPFLVEWAAREAATEAALAVAGEEKLDEQVIAACIAVGRKKHRDLREQGAGVGTSVHQQAKVVLVPGWKPDDEEYVDGGIEADMAMEAFHEWWEAASPTWDVVACERIVVHPSGSYVGTFDVLLRHKLGGHYRLVDFKTSNQSEDNPLALYPEYLFQIAAYRKAIIESPEYVGITEIDDAQVVALGKQGQLGVTTFDAEMLDDYAVAFTHMAAMFPMYRQAERNIRAFNKIEKARRAEEEA